jgi:hypothetical protein
MRFLAFSIVVLLVFSTISRAYAQTVWYMERPGSALSICQRVESSQTDYNASVGLGVYIAGLVSLNGYDVVPLNVSMTANSRKGISYFGDTQGPFSGPGQRVAWIDPSWLCDVNSSVASQVGDDFIVPCDMSYSNYYGVPFDFRFFGGANTGQYTTCYISSSGFVSFDNTTQPSPSPVNASNSNKPNALIAGVWTHLNVTGGNSQIIAGFYSPFAVGPNRLYFVIVWNNVIDESTQTPLTFEIVLQDDPSSLGTPYTYYQSDFWINYNSVSSINQSWARGFKDQTGTISQAVTCTGNELGSIIKNGDVEHYSKPDGYILDSLTLQFYDSNGGVRVFQSVNGGDKRLEPRTHVPRAVP